MKRKLTGLFVAVCLILTMGLTGCAGVELAGLEVSGSIPVLAVGSSSPVALQYSFSKETPTEEEIATVLEQVQIVWASSDEAVATVDENGNVTAVAPGTATITVSDSEKLYSATVDVIVLVPLESATVQEDLTLDLLAEETAKLEVEVQPAEATNTAITYASSDENIAAVDASGLVTPVAEGTATITTTVTGEGVDGAIEKTLTTEITVALLPQGIELEETEGILYVGYSHQLEPHTLPEETPASTYTYKSSDEDVATVDEDGNIKAVATGEATITVTSKEGHTAEYALTVTNAPRQTSGGNTTSGGTGSTAAPPTGGETPVAPPPTGGETPAAPPPAGTTPPPAETPPADSGGGSSSVNPYPIGTPENPAGGATVDVGEDDLHGGDGLAGDAW